MTLSEIINKALTLLREDTVTPDAEITAILTMGVNYWQLMLANTIHALMKDSGVLTFSQEMDLPEDCVRLLYVTDADAGTALSGSDWQIAGAKILFTVTGEDAPARVRFRYTRNPARLTRDGDTPEIPESYHELLAIAAAGFYAVASKRYNQYSVYQSMVMDVVSNQMPLNAFAMTNPSVPDATAGG